MLLKYVDRGINYLIGKDVYFTDMSDTEWTNISGAERYVQESNIGKDDPEYSLIDLDGDGDSVTVVCEGKRMFLLANNCEGHGAFHLFDLVNHGE